MNVRRRALCFCLHSSSWCSGRQCGGSGSINNNVDEDLSDEKSEQELQEKQSPVQRSEVELFTEDEKSNGWAGGRNEGFLKW